MYMLGIDKNHSYLREYDKEKTKTKTNTMEKERRKAPLQANVIREAFEESCFHLTQTASHHD